MEQLAHLMAELGLETWGVCRYEDTLPLLPTRSRNRIPKDAQSVIVILFGYYIGEYPERNISRYAMVDDYHQVIRGILERLVENLLNLFKTQLFIPFVDASPIQEVKAAWLAGLGDVGQNGLLLSPVYGNCCFIGEIVTDLPLPPSQERLSLCNQCGACLRACPTGALGKEGLAKEKCRSHITQKKGDLSPWEAQQVQQGGFVWGCDRCADACPINQNKKWASLEAFYQDIQPVVGKDNAGRLCQTKAYGWRGESVLLRNLRLIEGSDSPTEKGDSPVDADR